jgi:hypothetical protein
LTGLPVLDVAACSADRRISLTGVIDETERASEPDESAAEDETTDAAIDGPDFDDPNFDDPDFEGPDFDLELEPSADPINTARRRHGMAGAVLAAGLFGVDVALGRKPREDIPVVVASNSEPVDIDTDGIRVDLDGETSVVAPALPRSEPQQRPRRSRRARRGA